MKMHPEVVLMSESKATKIGMEKTLRRATFKLVCGLSFAILAVATPLAWINGQDDGHYLVPT